MTTPEISSSKTLADASESLEAMKEVLCLINDGKAITPEILQLVKIHTDRIGVEDVVALGVKSAISKLEFKILQARRLPFY